MPSPGYPHIRIVGVIHKFVKILSDLCTYPLCCEAATQRDFLEASLATQRRGLFWGLFYVPKMAMPYRIWCSGENSGDAGTRYFPNAHHV